jgi:hypothetical protein
LIITLPPSDLSSTVSGHGDDDVLVDIHLNMGSRTNDDGRLPFLDDGRALQHHPWHKPIAIIDRAIQISRGLREVRWTFGFTSAVKGS